MTDSMAVRIGLGVSPLLILFGCATNEEPDLAPADSGFVTIGEDDGGSAFPGPGGTGGSMLPPLGGQGGDPGLPGTGGGIPPAGDGACPPGTKLCSGLCVGPAPRIGCDLTGCTGCPEPPANADAVCSGTDCDWSCRTGFVEIDGACTMPTANGGASGTGGTFTIPGGGSAGSSTGSCNASSCTGCSVAGPIGCCTSSGRCGCTWAPGAYCL
jgi:hypothetical protein